MSGDAILIWYQLLLTTSNDYHFSHCMFSQIFLTFITEHSDYDEDCAAGLTCWYDWKDEAENATVPGCSGSPKKYWEYCIDPSFLPKYNVTHSDKLEDFGDDVPPASLGHCQGDW